MILIIMNSYIIKAPISKSEKKNNKDNKIIINILLN